jgi:hypothetical protein
MIVIEIHWLFFTGSTLPLSVILLTQKTFIDDEKRFYDADRKAICTPKMDTPMFPSINSERVCCRLGMEVSKTSPVRYILFLCMVIIRQFFCMKYIQYTLVLKQFHSLTKTLLDSE